MRIEKLNENKVQVTLTGADLNGYDISVHQLVHDSTELHGFLLKIMETIHKKTGFNPYNGQIVVEAQTIGDGISIIVSKIEKSKTTEIVKNGKRIKAKLSDNQKGVDTYYFENFDDVCEALMHIEPKIHNGNELYKVDGNYCYLLNFENPIFADKKTLYKTVSVLSEFAKRASVFPTQYLYVREYGTLVAKGENLANMSDGLKKINKE